MATSWGGGNSKDLTTRLEAQQRVTDEFGRGADTCVDLDKGLKKISDAIIAQRKRTPLPNLSQKYYIEEMEFKKRIWESTFAKYGCRDIIENIRLKSIAVVETSSAIKQEKSVLDVGNKNNNNYIALGAVVMLVGLYFILK